MSTLPKILFLQSTISRDITYYRYLLPDSSYLSMGKDYESAAVAALELNRVREEVVPKSKLSPGSGGKLVSVLCDEYRPVKLRQTNSKATSDAVVQRLRNICKWMGDWSVSKTQVRQLNQLLSERAPEYRAYKAYRDTLRELFAFALFKKLFIQYC